MMISSQCLASAGLMLLSVLLLQGMFLLQVAHAADNGIGITPPRGWRSWNQFQCNIDQKLILAQYAAMAKPRDELTTTTTTTAARLSGLGGNDAAATTTTTTTAPRAAAGTTARSLVDLGYTTAGIDDCWQACNSGPGGKGYHNASGYPIVNTTLFPSLKDMTAAARKLGIVPGFYGNNCHCKETSDGPCGNGRRECFEADVKATIDYGK